MRSFLLLSLFILTLNLTQAQTTAIPDPNFEQVLINLGYDAVLDGQVLTANINNVTSLNLNFKNISDLTGIEDFTALRNLDCSVTPLAYMNLTQNLNLEYLSCYNNQLTSIDLSQNLALNWLDISDNLLTTLDVSQNTNLVEFRCYNNQISSLDVSQNTKLKNLRFQNNRVTGTMDLSQHSFLNYLDCRNNKLYSLNVKNGNNIYFYAAGFNVNNNPNLTCIEVDDSTWAANNWSSHIDSIASFSNNCFSNTVTTTLPSITICSGDSISIFGNYQTTSGYYYNVLTTTLGFDSIVQQPLIVLPLNLNNQNISICTGDSILIYGIYQNLEGVYYDSLQASNGCDSILSTTLTLNPVYYSNTNQTILQGDSVLLYGNYQSTSGVYYDSLQTTLGCDSVFSTTLIIDTCSASANYTYIDNGNGIYSFINTSTGNYNQIQWAFGNYTSTASDPSYTFIANGNYPVILTINDSTYDNSCYNYFIDTITVTGVPSPAQCVAGFVMYPDTSNSVTVVNSSVGSNLSYLWDFGDGTTSTQAYPTHTYATTGNYYLCLTIDDGNGCTDMYCDSIGQNGVVFNKASGFTINVVGTPIITGINNEFSINSKLNIYPNPTSTQLTLDTQLKIDQIIITDITGKTIKSIQPKSKTINVSDLTNGIYFIKIISGEETMIQKFVKN